MKSLDWIVLVCTLVVIILYGLYRSRSSKDLEGYFLSNRSMPWYIILLSIMGTQASAVTFLSAPGQAYTDGMRFVQYYFGLPLAAIVICIFFVPVFSKLKVFTAYEFLENRFDGRTRVFTSLLFLLQRGLSTGISIFAPSLILSVIFGWNIYVTNLLMGGVLIIYTVSGGARAVAYTQQLQFFIIMGALFMAGYFIVQKLPAGMGFSDALQVGGKLGKFNIITTGFTEGKFDWGDKYNIFSGIIGGFFLALSYFGTDQSQVGRYLTAKNMKESRMGLLMNGMVKVPMQFLILLLGLLVFSFYQFHQAPAFFNQYEIDRLENSGNKSQIQLLQSRLQKINDQKSILLADYAKENENAKLQQLHILQDSVSMIRTDIKGLIKQNGGSDSDTNYIFLRFVIDYLPAGLVGLIIAVIFLASWGSIAAAINSLASSTVIDIHKKYVKNGNPSDDYRYSKLYTVGWSLFCMAVAMFVSNWTSSLIEVVNVLGSLFYGTILGIFLVAFFAKQVKGVAVLIAAVITEIVIIMLFVLNEYDKISLGFLWLNVIGAMMVYLLAILIQTFFVKKELSTK
ncbi:MAG TPA: sodium:solute symporter [Niabella sp.]|nr:sodium:solute symporter [Niabella sp.]HQW14949.1 sodium:solute symporter [Niabella sp.]HQX20159.1 sodium:solute symporter [Niabella sp.]HQX41915.1 sodium:solute symporter [Niabella sp.]HRB06764.1 sodium:solute symporter [Niabella sp.]